MPRLNELPRVDPANGGDLAGVSGGATVRFSIPALGRALPARDVPSLRDFASLAVPGDWTAALRALIAAVPDDGGFGLIPQGVYLVDGGNRMDGQAAGMDLPGWKTGVKLVGQGFGSRLVKKAQADIATVDGRRGGVLVALSGHGHEIRDMWVEGNWSRGGTSPPYTSNWRAGYVYGLPSSGVRVVSTAPDGTPASPRARGDRAFLQLQAHTSNATNILPDVAAGRWREVTAERWDEMTGSGYLNAWDVDTDFAYRQCIYMNGLAEPMRRPVVASTRVTDAVYCGIMMAAGPLFADLVGFGTEDALCADCEVTDIRGTGIGGGFGVRRMVSNPVVKRCGSSQIRFDGGSTDSVLLGGSVDGAGAVGGASHGVAFYESERGRVIGTRIAGAAIGLSVSASADVQALGAFVTGNGTGVSFDGSPGFILDAEVVANTSDGIKVNSNCHNGTVRGISRENGRHGLNAEDVYALDVTGLRTFGNGKAGQRFATVRSSTICGANSYNNGATETVADDAAGLLLDGCTGLRLVAPQVFDSRSGTARTQRVGLVLRNGSGNEVLSLRGFGHVVGNVSNPEGALILGSTFSGAVRNGNAFAFAALPAASAWTDAQVVVTDRNRRPAYSDGTAWRWLDGSVVS